MHDAKTVNKWMLSQIALTLRFLITLPHLQGFSSKFAQHLDAQVKVFGEFHNNHICRMADKF